jgi:hypothetical protein
MGHHEKIMPESRVFDKDKLVTLAILFETELKCTVDEYSLFSESSPLAPNSGQVHRVGMARFLDGLAEIRGLFGRCVDELSKMALRVWFPENEERGKGRTDTPSEGHAPSDHGIKFGLPEVTHIQIFEMRLATLW